MCGSVLTFHNLAWKPGHLSREWLLPGTQTRREARARGAAGAEIPDSFPSEQKSLPGREHVQDHSHPILTERSRPETLGDSCSSQKAASAFSGVPVPEGHPFGEPGPLGARPPSTCVRRVGRPWSVLWGEVDRHRPGCPPGEWKRLVSLPWSLERWCR